MTHSTDRELDAFLTGLMPRLGELARNGFEDPGPVRFKTRGQPVTATDREIERIAMEAILSRWPDHAILGEESGHTRGEAEVTWFIDPLDGTANFVHGLPFFSVSIGVARGGRMVAGHVLDPLRDEHFRAVEGGGAWLGGRRLVMEDPPDLLHANVSMQTSAGGAYMQKPGFFRDLHRRTQKTRKLGSMALELAYVAAGRLDLLIAGKSSPQAWWDLAGGWKLVEEAGGTLVDLDGLEITPETSHLVAGPEPLVREFLEWFEGYE